MPDLKPETQEQLRAQCRKISVAHDLDQELQEELYGHMEDKALAYLSGQEPVTESDAVILTQKHFGDPKVIDALLGEVHVGAARISILRRIGAIVVAILLVEVYWQAAFGAIFGLGLLSGVESRTLLYSMRGHFLFSLAWISRPVMLWLLLKHWQRRISQGGQPWFAKWGPILMVSLPLMLMFVARALPTAHTADFFARPLYLLNASSLRMFLSWPGHSIEILLSICTLFIWIWWLGATSMRPARFGLAIGGWYIFSTVFASLLQTINFSFINTNEAGGISLQSPPPAFHFLPGWCEPIFMHELLHDLLTRYLVIGLIMASVYCLVYLWNKKRQKPVQVN